MKNSKKCFLGAAESLSAASSKGKEDSAKKRLAICDLDGTLIDSRADLAAAINNTRRYFNLTPFDIDTVTSFVGHGAERLVQRAFGDSQIDIQSALAIFKSNYSENICVETKLYPTVSEGLAMLKKNNFSVAVISNKPTDHCLKILDILGIKNCFDIVFGGDCHPLKPDPTSIFEAIRLSCADINSTWIIGDSAVDAQAARNAKIKSCYARYGFFKVDEALFDHAVDSFIEFCQAISNN